MAGYKVPQDVEADDKFLGPLSFKQFIFFGIAGICAYLMFFFGSKGIWPLAVIVFIPFVLAAVLAFPWSKDQPTELWLASRIRFFIKPRKQVWDQSGIKHLVKVTAPIREAHLYTDGLAPTQVQDRLSALAAIADSRGWAVKNSNPFAPGAAPVTDRPETSDRLVAVQTPVLDKEEQQYKETPDVLDEDSGIIAKQFDSLIGRSEEKHRQVTQQLVAEARKSIQTPDAPKDPAKDANFWFKHQQKAERSGKEPGGLDGGKGLTTFNSSTVVAPSQHVNTPVAQPNTQDPAMGTGQPVAVTAPAGQPIDDKAVIEQFKEKQRIDKMQAGSSHIKRIPTLSEMRAQEAEDARNAAAAAAQQAQLTAQAEAEKPVVTTPKDPVILDLARNNDQNIATLGRRANRQDKLPPDEVVVPLR